MEAKKSTRGGAGRGQGRKPLNTESPTVVVSIKMSADQREKLQRLGGPTWIRARIDRAHEPKSAEEFLENTEAPPHREDSMKPHLRARPLLGDPFGDGHDQHATGEG